MCGRVLSNAQRIATRMSNRHAKLKTNKTSETRDEPIMGNKKLSTSGDAINYFSGGSSKSQEKPVPSGSLNETTLAPVMPATRLEVKNTPPNSLAWNTPAWSEKGRIGIGPSFFQTESNKQSEILRHEYIHSIHQNCTTENNSLLSRRHAESVASGYLPISKKTLSVPAPDLLAFPVQSHKPWDSVYIGNTGIIGELVQGGLTLRIKMEYGEFGIKDIYKHNKSLDMEIIDKHDFSIYHCGKHPNKTLAAKVVKLRKVMSKVEQLNKKIPSSSTFSIQYIFISSHASERYRTANNKGILFLDSRTLSTSIIDAAAHEASHGILEHHATAGDKDPGNRVPDNFALRIMDIFTKLRATKSVAMPDKKFDPKAPPAFSSKSGKMAASGIIPIHDSVWSGSGGHPNSVDEFFASAFAAYIQVPKLLAKIVNHYNKHDNTIKPIYAELLGLFKKVGSPKDLKSIAEPADKKKALNSLASISAPLDYTDPSKIAVSDEAFFNPLSLKGPSNIKCKP